MITDSEERILMERTAAGDRRAFRSLFDAYYPVVYGFMRSLLHTEEDASDVAQEVFIKLWLMRAALPDITSLRFYLYRMSLNQTINYIKKNRLHNGVALADIPYDQMVEEVIDMKGKEAFIASVVERMPEQRRKVFIMSRFENRSNDEIASLLNIKKENGGEPPQPRAEGVESSSPRFTFPVYRLFLSHARRRDASTPCFPTN